MKNHNIGFIKWWLKLINIFEYIHATEPDAPSPSFLNISRDEDPDGAVVVQYDRLVSECKQFDWCTAHRSWTAHQSLLLFESGPEPSRSSATAHRCPPDPCTPCPGIPDTPWVRTPAPAALRGTAWSEVAKPPHRSLLRPCSEDRAYAPNAAP